MKTLFSCVVCLVCFIISSASAGPLPSSPPTPLAGLVLNGTLFFNLIPPVEFDIFGTYIVFQPGPTPASFSTMEFTALGTPSPFLGTRIDAILFHFGRASAVLTYEMEILGPPGSVPIQIDVSSIVFGNLDPGIGSAPLS